MGEEALQEEVEEVIGERFSFYVIGRRALGRNWSRLDQDQQERFTALFTDLLVKTYTERYRGDEDIEVTWGKAVRLTDRKMEIDSTIILYGEDGETAPAAFDPIEGFNRGVFVFNDFVYTNVFDPVATGYDWVMPNFALTGIRSFFRNLGMPILGPSTAYDAVGLVGEWYLYPVTYIDDFEIEAALYGLDFVNLLPPTVEQYKEIDATSVDPYTAFRDAYLKNRQFELDR